MAGQASQKGSVRALKAVVIGMGVLILVLAAVMIGELFRRAFLAGDGGTAMPVEARTVGLDLPAGARVTALAATEDRVVVHAVLPGGEDRLFILDPESATITAIVVPAAPALPE